MNGRQRAGSPPISRDGEDPMQASHILQAAGRRPEGQEFLSVVSLRPRRRLMEERPDRDRPAGPKSARRGVACPSGRNRSGNEAVLTATTKRSDMAWHVHGSRASRFPTRALQRNSSGARGEDAAHTAFVAGLWNDDDVFAPDGPALAGPQQSTALRRTS